LEFENVIADNFNAIEKPQDTSYNVERKITLPWRNFVNDQLPHPSRSLKSILIFLFLIYTVVLIRTAWVNEDAYITMRTVDNFVHGYGMRWNIAERVQTFTHPLWFFLITIPYFFTREAFYTLLFLSVMISLAVYILAIIHVKQPNLATLAVLTILIFSKSFVDYSSSGFENPATHLLLAGFLLLFLNHADEDFLAGRTVFFMALIAGLAVLNRMDTFLFFLPALALIFIKRRKWETLKYILLGFLPFIAWEIFCIIYYGFPFPNTAYAKLYTGIPRLDLIEEGFLYVLNSLNWDPITLVAIATGTGLALLLGSWKERSVGLGIVLYVSYVVWIGADYMSGRFFSGALLVSVILLIRQFKDFDLAKGILVLALIFALGFASPTPTLISVSDETYSTGRTDVNGIVDWRSWSFQTSGLLYIRKGYMKPYHEWALRGLKFKKSQIRFLVNGNVGYIGYFAGPRLHIIDPNALADPLLARLKPIEIPDWQAGHFRRAVPAGYVETLRAGTNLFEDPHLGEFYEKLSLITRGPIFSWKRFVTIWKMNTGQYNYLLKEYEKNQRETASP
jgi:arabinofuranosyltransferase